MAKGLWVRLIKHSRIVRDVTMPCEDDWHDALYAACHALDLPRPIVLQRHERDWREFRQTRFLPEHFLESVTFDRMEIEYIDPDSRKKHNHDPRNG